MDSQVEQLQTQTLDASPESTQEQQPAQSTTQQQIQNAIELDKAERIKFKGQEYKREDFEKALMFQKDYTKKTQALSKERETYAKTQEEDKHYMSHLPYDLQRVMNNPQLAAQFIKTYPERFHSYLKTVLEQNEEPKAQEHRGQGVDVELLSRVEKIEKSHFEQEVSKREQEISSQVDRLSKQYPDAIPEMVIGRVFESYVQNKEKPTDETWENAFKQVDEQMKNLVKTKYGNLVKQQTQANKKASDVDQGGGTPGRAPQKFKNLKEVTEFAAKDLSGRQ